MTLFAFAAERRAAAPLLLAPAGCHPVDQCLLSTWRSPVNPPHAAAAVDRWDRQTDRRTGVQPFHRPSSMPSPNFPDG